MSSQLRWGSDGSTLWLSRWLQLWCAVGALAVVGLAGWPSPTRAQEAEAVPNVQAEAPRAFPSRPPPRLLSEQEVESGLDLRLDRMEGRQAAREAREIAEQAEAVHGSGVGAAADQAVDIVPPRAPDPPPPAESLEE